MAEDGEWLAEQLALQREDLREKAAEGQEVLAHLESHLRELAGEAQRLEAAWAQLQQQDSARQASRNELLARKRKLEAQLEQAQRDLAEARQRAAAAKPAWAILPYDGPNGTRRRPIYLECRRDGIFIQPEGVRLAEADFGPMLGPGNPLEAALRALREYYRKAGLPGLPYPLLIVRPDGTETYALARAALRNWDDEFGYELIEADRKLQFPPASPAIADLLRRTIAVAKQRQAMLAAAMPAAYGRGGGGGDGGADGGRAGGVAVSGGRKLSGTDVAGAAPVRGGGIGRGGPERSGMGRPGTASSREADRRPSGAKGRAYPASGRAGGAAAPGGATGYGAGGGSAFAAARQQGVPNWGLPPRPPGAVAITRPVQVVLSRDHFTLLPERGDPRSVPTAIALPGRLNDRIDAIVGAIWKRMESWGLAVAGGYWRPVLVVQVAPGAEARYAELVAALQNSGLRVERAVR
ncbi:MAG TPA: hypothetical protein ENJ62_05440 [Bryobacterales bacterium]|nr:hypothetical protein [Bryobacterales bacterium]